MAETEPKTLEELAQAAQTADGADAPAPETPTVPEAPDAQAEPLEQPAAPEIPDIQPEPPETPAAPAPEAGKPADGPPAMGQLLGRLECMEQLLQKQTALTEKMNKSKTLQTVLLLCLVVVLAVGLFALNATVQNATNGLPELIQSTTRAVDEITTDLSSVDFDTLNDTIGDIRDGVAAIDFDKLNQSIQSLQEVAESLANLTQLFR